MASGTSTRSASRRRPDLVVLACCIAAAAVAAWTMAPLATGASRSVSSDTRIDVNVPVSTSVVPGWRSGDEAVRIPNLGLPGSPRDVASEGWQMTTNWSNGYEVRLRATSAPALRGQNAVDGRGTQTSFADYRKDGCPCPWSGDGYETGVFGYSVSVDANAGAAPLDAARWGSPRQRLWRGFSQDSHRAYATQGGSGRYTMSIHLRSMIPDGAVQEAGSYRARLVVSAHPLL